MVVCVTPILHLRSSCYHVKFIHISSVQEMCYKCSDFKIKEHLWCLEQLKLLMEWTGLRSIKGSVPLRSASWFSDMCLWRICRQLLSSSWLKPCLVGQTWWRTSPENGSPCLAPPPGEDERRRLSFHLHTIFFCPCSCIDRPGVQALIVSAEMWVGIKYAISGVLMTLPNNPPIQQEIGGRWDTSCWGDGADPGFLRVVVCMITSSKETLACKTMTSQREKPSRNKGDKISYRAQKNYFKIKLVSESTFGLFWVKKTSSHTG